MFIIFINRNWMCDFTLIYYVLQMAFLPKSTKVLQVDSSSLRVPLTLETHRYCWSHPYLGLLVVPADGIPSDLNSANNLRFYRVIFDCGGWCTV